MALTASAMEADRERSLRAGMDAHLTKSIERGRLFATLAVTVSIMVAELVGGWLSGSLALLADAGHMLTDFAALALAWPVSQHMTSTPWSRAA